MDKVVGQPFISLNCQTRSFSHQSKCNESEQNLTVTSRYQSHSRLRNNVPAQQIAKKYDWFLFVVCYFLLVLTVLVYYGCRYIHVTINTIICHHCSEKLFCIENIFNPHHPSEAGPNCSRVRRPWTCCDHSSHPIWK